jgi:molybdate transport system ATP-binding protein
VLEHDPAHGLMRIGRDASSLWVGATTAAQGQHVRARVLARDVSVTRQAPAETSILNVIPVVLDTVVAGHATALLRLNVRGAADAPSPGDWTLLARITTRSLELLDLQPGDALHAQIKGVALM